MFRLGAATRKHLHITREIFECYRANGIKAMEISPSYSEMGFDFAIDHVKATDYKLLAKYAQETEVELWSQHLPYGMKEYNPANLDKAFREKTIEMDCEILKIISDAGIKVAVIHPSGEPVKDSERSDGLKYAAESILKINETARACGITLAVENLPRTCLCNHSDELLQIIDADNTLRVCFDVNHLLIQSHKDFVDAVGSKIVTLHISDYDFTDEKHWLPGEGKINWPELLTLLKGINYAGPFMNEVATFPDGNVPHGCASYAQLKAANEKILGCL